MTRPGQVGAPAKHATAARPRRAALPTTAGTGAAASIALAILVLVCAFVAVAVPRASLGYRTAVLQQMLRTSPSSQTTVLADATITGLSGSYLGAANLTAAQAQLAAGLRRGALPLAPPAQDWSGLATGSTPYSGGRPPRTGAPPQLELLYRGGLSHNATLVSGSMPSATAAPGASGAIQIAVTAATAAKFGLHAGIQLRAASRTLVVTGILRPRGAASSFWTVDPLAAAPQLFQLSRLSAPFWGGAAFVGGGGLAAMQQLLSAEPLHALWSFPLNLGSIDADQAAGLLQRLRTLAYLPAATSVSTGLNSSVAGAAGAGLSLSQGQGATVQISLSSGLVATLPPFVTTDDGVQRALSLLFVSLAVIAAVVVLLGARLVAEHRRGEFTMMRARGASLRQVAMIALAGGAAAALPAAAVAVGAAILATPGAPSVLSWWLAGLIIAAALAGPPLLAVWWHRTPRAAARSGTGRRRIAAARRWVADVMLVAAAVGGLAVLRQQGLPPPGSLDLFTSAAPVLTATPVALLVMRAYPVLLRQATRLAGRRRGVVLVVGLARSGAAARAGVLPAFALVLGFTVAAFATMARGAVQSADVVASWQSAGADAVVTAPVVGPGIPAAAQRRIAGVPGVRRFATISLAGGATARGLQIPVVIVDPGRYAALTAGTPVPPFPAAALARPAGGGQVPVLLSSAGRAILGPRGDLFAAGRNLRVRVVGTLNNIPGAQPGGQFVVLPRWALGAQAPSPAVMAITGPRLDTRALITAAHRAVPGSQVTLRSRLLAAISGAPLPHGGFITFAQGAAAAGAFSLLVLALTMVLSARSRELTLARLTTMGLGPTQSRRITVVETLPAILAAALGGTACALALVPLVGPAVDLAAFTGMPVSVTLHANLITIAVTAGGLMLLAALTLVIQDRLAQHRGTAQALRVGE